MAALRASTRSSRPHSHGPQSIPPIYQRSPADLRGAGQRDNELRFARLRVDLNAAVKLLDHDPVNNVEPQACALPCRLGGEEGFEDPALGFHGDARPIIGDPNQNLLTI